MEKLKISPLRKNLWALDEVGKTVMYLINGKSRALLIDTGFGLCDLKQTVRELCGEKELIVVNTHGHLDHDWGNNQFERVCIGRYDEPDAHHKPDAQEMEQVAKAFFERYLEEGGSLEGWNPGPAPKVLALEENDEIDLLDYRLKVFETPGHSLGSIALFEEREGWLFTGDSMLTWEVWGQLERSATLAVYGKSMRKLARMQDRVSAVFPAHWDEERSPGYPRAYELPPSVLSIYADGIEAALKGELAWTDYSSGMELADGARTVKCVYFPIGGIAFDPERTGV